jgi:UDPglucose 6-dehydrogenase
MLAEGFELKAYDPVIPPEGTGNIRPPDEFGVPPEIQVCRSEAECAEGAHALVIMTDKDEFKDLDLNKLGRRMKKRVLVDAANLYDPGRAAKAGFTYIAIGRGFQWR